jgi:ferredoxin
MERQIIEIDPNACNGCGLCADACAEGAIGMIGGKARLLRDDHCDGLGNCLPVCPTGAIRFVRREAKEYDAKAVKANTQKREPACVGGCPGARTREIRPATAPATSNVKQSATENNGAPAGELRQWPVQIELVPVSAPFFDGADLLIAADCAAYARASFHAEYMRGRITLIACPKLNETDYGGKLADIIANRDIRSLTAIRMEVPCCCGIEHAAAGALKKTGKTIPLSVVTLGTNGEIRC